MLICSKPFQQVILDYDYTFTTPYSGSETIDLDMEQVSHRHSSLKFTNLPLVAFKTMIFSFEFLSTSLSFDDYITLFMFQNCSKIHLCIT